MLGPCPGPPSFSAVYRWVCAVGSGEVAAVDGAMQWRCGSEDVEAEAGGLSSGLCRRHVPSIVVSFPILLSPSVP